MPDERDIFGAFVRRHGVTRPGPGTPAPTQVPNGACWDAVWAAAEAHDTFYVEGVCLLTPEQTGGRYGVVNAHAWEERMTPFGLQVVEHTLGYENVSSYIGVRINRTFAREMTSDWGYERASVIEAAIVGKWPSEHILSRIVLPQSA